MSSLAQLPDNLVTLGSNCSIIKSPENVSVSSNVGPGNAQVTYILSWQNATSVLDMVLRSPGGKNFNSSAQAPDFYQKNTTKIYYIISTPEPGNWTAEISAKTTPKLGEDYCVLTLLTLSESQLSGNESGNITEGKGCPTCNQSG